MVIPQGLDFAGVNGMATDGDLFSRISWLVLLGGASYLISRNWARVRQMCVATNRPLFVFVVLATLSLMWSIDPGITFKRLFRLYTIILVCLAFAAAGWRPQSFQKCLRTMLFVILASSAIFCYLDPQLAIHQYGDLAGAWHGITTGKNLFGSLAGCAFLVWLHAYLTRETGRFLCFVNVLLAGLCLIKSHSSTSLLATVFGTFFLLLLLRKSGTARRYMPYVVGIFAVAVLMYGMAVLRIIPGMDAILAPISSLTGKDETFTGRANIWYVLKLHIHLHPLLGTGYGAYWVGPNPASQSYEMVRQLFFYPTEGHNGYLDVINDLGYVGVICLLAYFVSYLRQSLRLFRLNQGAGALYLALIFRGFLADMSESHWLSVFSIDFVIFTLATFCLTRELLYSQESTKAQVSTPEIQVQKWRRMPQRRPLASAR